MRKTIAPVLLTAGLLSACANPGKSYLVLLDNPDGTTGRVVVKGSRGEQVVDQSGHCLPLDGSRAAAAVPESRIREDYGAAITSRPVLPVHFRLYFASGDTRLTPESAALLPEIIADAAKQPAVDIPIIGHTDTMGKAELNESLALKRAQTVAELIQGRGLKAHALTVESHGERNLLVQTPNETLEPRNRRVEISLR